MKNKLVFLASSFAVILIALLSCNDKSDTPPKTKTQLLAQGTWKFKSASASGTDISNQSPPFDPCKKDNILTFTAAGAGNVNEGATKCNGADPDNVPFTWTLTNNETTLTVSAALFNGLNNNFTLVSVSETELVVSQGYAPPVGPVLLVQITFQH
jgi:hypothetical protein